MTIRVSGGKGDGAEDKALADRIEHLMTIGLLVSASGGGRPPEPAGTERNQNGF